jgi:hypothetical protein
MSAKPALRTRKQKKWIFTVGFSDFPRKNNKKHHGVEIKPCNINE